MEKRKLEKNSGSTSLNIPKKFCKIVGLRPGIYVNVTLTIDKKILVEPADQKAEQTTP